jgi:acetyl-CoA C-acetyltransferase
MAPLGGALRSLAAADLGAAALTGALAGTEPGRVGSVILGQAVQAGCGPNPARTAALKAGLPGVPAFTLNQGALSGLQAVVQAALGLQDGACHRALAGGMESSSAAPYLLPTARFGTRMGAAPVLDALLLDGWEEAAPPPADSLEAVILQSRARAAAAREAGLFRPELAPLTVTGRRGTQSLTDDEPVPTLGEAAGPADGAAALLLASTRGLEGHPPLARLTWAQGQDSAEAITRLLRRSGLSFLDLGCLELDEAHPAHLLHLLSAFPDLPLARVNALGGALALGQPLGAAGARLLVTLAHQLRHLGHRHGLAAMASPGFALAFLLEQP